VEVVAAVSIEINGDQRRVGRLEANGRIVGTAIRILGTLMMAGVGLRRTATMLTGAMEMKTKHVATTENTASTTFSAAADGSTAIKPRENQCQYNEKCNKK